MPTVVRRRGLFLLSLRRVRIAPRVAAIRFAERKETIAQTCCTAMQSSSDGSTPKRVKISLALVSPSLLLKKDVVLL